MLLGPRPARGLQLPEATSSAFALAEHASPEMKSRLQLCSSEGKRVQAKQSGGADSILPFLPPRKLWTRGGQGEMDLETPGLWVSGGGPAGGMGWRCRQIFNIPSNDTEGRARGTFALETCRAGAGGAGHGQGSTLARQ